MGKRTMGRWGVVLLVSWTLGCGPSPEDETVLATYRGGEVTEAEYRSWLAYADAEHDAERMPDVLTTIAAHEALAAAAIEQGLDRQPLRQLILADDEDRRLEQALRGTTFRAIEVDEAEIDAWLADNGARLDRPPRVRLSNIFKRRAGDDFDALRRTMAAIRQQLVDGADWAEMALRESDSQTRFRKGSIGRVKPGSLDPTIEEIAFGMAPGEISEVIETPDGLTILRCDGVEAAKRPSEEEKRERAVQKVREAKWRRTWEALQAELLAAVTMDVSAAQRVSTAPDAVVVEAEGDDGWRLTRAETEARLRRRGVQRALADLPEARATQLLESLALDLQAANEARRRGLDDEPSLRNQMAWQRVLTLGAAELERRVGERFVPLRDEEIQAYFEADRDRYQVEEQFRLAAISWNATKADLRAAYTLGEKIEADLRAGRTTFEAAAASHSELPSAKRGGELGWRSRTQVAALGRHVFGAAMALEIGEVSRLVQQPAALPSTDSSLWLVRLLGRRPARPMTYDEARRQVENALGNERTKALQAQLEQELVDDLGIEIVGEVAGS